MPDLVVRDASRGAQHRKRRFIVTSRATTRHSPITYLSEDRRLVPYDGTGNLLVADSWLVQDGAARAYDLHWQRFLRSVGEHGVTRRQVDAFRAEVTAALPRAGAWFPRIELVDAPTRLVFRLRPAPPLRRTARAWVADVTDPRMRPTIKGPDFPALQRLRNRAQRLGADEAILLDRDGHVVEGAFSSLLWWDRDELRTRPDNDPILPGVTRRLVLEQAARLGLPVRYMRATPADLAGCEVWITSALHGIRAVTDWVPPRGTPAAAPHAQQFQTFLESQMKPLPLH
jgi:branched-subunit amino acid aminotransferase/4-amino-4-deoxychorismate lyase